MVPVLEGGGILVATWSRAEEPLLTAGQLLEAEPYNQPIVDPRYLRMLSPE